MSELDVLGVLHGTDKSSTTSFSWDYLRHYEELFNRWRHNNINMIEIGVLGGNSLRTWLRFFDKATYVGIDINPDCHRLAQDRAIIKIGSQEDPGFLQAVAREYPPTIVIDDGSHIAHHMIASFEALFPSLLPGGVYVFEDLSFHFADGGGQWKGATAHQGLADTSIYDYLSRFVRARAANSDVPEGSWGFARYAFEQIDSITVFGGVISVRKRAPPDLSHITALFERELTKSNHNIDFAERYADYLIKKNGDLDRSLSLIQDVLAANPKRLSALSLLTDVLVRLDRLDEAANTAKRLVDLDGGQTKWWLKLADIERSRNRLDLELASLQRIVALDARPREYDRVGVIHEHFGDLPAALTAARRANELEPNNAHFRDRVSRLERRVRVSS